MYPAGIGPVIEVGQACTYGKVGQTCAYDKAGLTCSYNK